MACDPAAVDQGQGMSGLIVIVVDATLILFQTRTSFLNYNSHPAASRIVRHVP